MNDQTEKAALQASGPPRQCVHFENLFRLQRGLLLGADLGRTRESDVLD